MVTAQMVESGYRPCPECRGTGRVMHGLLDATCEKPRHGGCGGVGLQFCRECRREWAFEGPLCRECRAFAPARKSEDTTQNPHR